MFRVNMPLLVFTLTTLMTLSAPGSVSSTRPMGHRSGGLIILLDEYECAGFDVVGSMSPLMTSIEFR